MSTLKQTFTLVACASVLLVTGCVKLWRKNLEIKTYMVEVRREAEAVQAPLAQKLWIDSVHVLPPYNIRNLILRKSDVEFTTSYYTELLMSPSENFRNGFFTWFSASGIFDDVSVVERKGMSHSLVVSVLEFYGDTTDHQTVLKIKATLFDEKTDGMRVLFSKDYQRRIQMPEASAEELIRAYNEAFTKILSDCEQDVVAALQ
ncbi:hypothetical protein PDESU_02314 [Pontiella desulfatans]|uniref:Uncharacterized protein n=1 Tax=Pontiella desulfatans TaxID=2750659 RepID=A0A6C2U1J2_PONDE|nr:ABC-type transport auxiliary lipoprotein family protein [Pontiella desulfatans]VGO13757.1 hypothetical protein PDESU_02314 [Pontiella desulfatans]